MMDRREFLSAALPTEGSHYCVVGIKQGEVQQLFAEDIDTVEEHVDHLLQAQNNVYIALAKFAEQRRLAKHAQCLRALFLDLDVSPQKAAEGKGYASQIDAVEALQKFCRVTGLPKPTIVSSGGGLHVYWIFEQAVEAARWKPVAEELKSLCAQHELLADPAVTADAARILRVPETLNFKNSAHPSSVEVLGEGKPRAFAFYESLLQPSNPLANAPKRELDEATRALLGNRVSDFKKIIEFSLAGKGCAQLLNVYQDQEHIEEPLWRAGLSIAWHCEDAESAIHEMSKQHSAYDEEQTLKKAQATKGPYTCETFGKLNPKGCQGCPLKGQITSPIQIGSTIKAAPDTPIEVHEVSALNGKLQRFEIPGFPYPYFRGVNGGIYRYENNKKAKSTDDGDGDDDDDNPAKLIYHHDLYAVQRMMDQRDGEILLLRLHLPRDGVREWSMPLADMMAKDRLRDTIAAKGVAATGRQLEEIMMYLNKWVNHLQATSHAEETRIQMGWAAGNQAFVLGEREYHANGVSFTPPSPVVARYASKFTRQGDLGVWKGAINKLFARPGEEPRAFLLGVGLATPMLRWTQIRGGVVHVRSDGSGKAKSLVQECINSIWGSPIGLLMSGKDTAASMLNRMGVYNSTPLCVDEITNIEPKTLSTLVYAATHGEGPNRMEGSTNEERLNIAHWRTLIVTSGNSSLIDRLTSAKLAPEGELMRLLELDFGDKDNGFTRDENTRIMRDVHQNHGLAADVIVPWMLTHASECQKIVDDMMLKLEADTGFGAKERFWTTMASLGIIGVVLGNKLELWDFDQTAIYQWLLGTLKSLAAQPSAVSRDPRNAIGLFLQEHLTNTLVINSGADRRTGMPFAPIQEPRGPLVVRSEPDSELIYVSAKHLRDWCSKHQIGYASLVQGLEEKQILKETKKVRMSKGSAVNAPAVNAVVLDGKHFEVDIDAQAN